MCNHDLIKQAKSEADLLMKALKEKGIPTTRSQALELVAASHNFNDWNRYRAYLERHPVLMPVSELEYLPRCTILSGPTGAGKTWVLSRFGEQLSTIGHPPLWITNYPIQHDPSLTAALPSSQIVTLRMPQGPLTDDYIRQEWLPLLLAGLDTTELPAKGLAIEIVSDFRNSDRLSSALALLVPHIEQALSHQTWRPGAVLVDEADYFRLEELADLQQELTLISRSGEVVLTTQSGSRVASGNRCLHLALFRSRARTHQIGVQCVEQGRDVPARKLVDWLNFCGELSTPSS